MYYGGAVQSYGKFSCFNASRCFAGRFWRTNVRISHIYVYVCIISIHFFSIFSELDITSSVNARAPEPILDVAVRQGGQIVSGELNVSPGTPLSMEIYLDKVSAPVYGLGVTYMQVTDTKSQEETIIFNGYVQHAGRSEQSSNL